MTSDKDISSNLPPFPALHLVCCPLQWTTNDVGRFLASADICKMPQYVEKFAEEGIDGEMLLELTDGELKDDLGIASRMHRKKILMKLTHFVK